jgi:acetate kinase
MDTILVVNAGSSSVKFQVFARAGAHDLKRLIKGQMDGVGSLPRLRANAADGALLVDQKFSAEKVSDLPTAMQTAGAWLRETQEIAPVAVGHRVVHGG